jgi:hypothetical protein
MRIILALCSMLFAFTIIKAQKTEPSQEFKCNRVNQEQKIKTFDLGINYSNAGNVIYFEDTARWNNKPDIGLNLGFSLFHSMQGFWIREGQIIFNVERQKFDSKYFSSILIFNYYFLLGYRLTDCLSIKAGVGIGALCSIMSNKSNNPLYRYNVDNFPFRFKTELTCALTSKILIGASWASVFEKPLYKVDNSEYIDKYNSMLFSIDLKYVISDKQSLIQNNNQYLKFAR